MTLVTKFKMAALGAVSIALGIIDTIPVHAITFNFAGQVNGVNFANGITQDNSIMLGTSFEGTFDTDALQAIVNVGSYTFQTEIPGSDFTQFSIVNGELDSFLSINIVEANNLLNPQRIPPGAIARLLFSAIDLSNNTLTISSEQFDPYESADFEITGEITSISKAPPTSVPESTSTLGLLSIGALGAGSMLKRKKQ